jgi:GTP-binding protein Era
MKAGYVAIIGRPNAGKSTLLNNILQHKVSITSPKPQTTRFPVQAIFEDERGQIIFIDTPGMFGRVHDPVAKKINPIAESVLREGVDVAVYLIDHSRERDLEENKILGLLRSFDVPKILALNKMDIKTPTFLPQYKFLEDEFTKTVEISGLQRSNINLLIDDIFELLPEGEAIFDRSLFPTPAVNIDSRMFLADIIREKAFLFLRKELPYTMTVIVDEKTEREDGLMYIKARIITTDDRYKRIIIGEKGRMIKEIGMAARKELETATSKKIFIELSVEVNRHWYDEL